LAEYDELLKDYAARGHEIPYMEDDQVKGLYEGFDILERALESRQAPWEGPRAREPFAKTENRTINFIRDSAENVVSTIRSDLHGRVIQGANDDYKICLWFV